jgi:Flp pilus assembly protein TadD
MASRFRGLVIASLSVSVLALAACGTTGSANLSNPEGASRVDSIMERAAREAKASGNKTETVALLEQVFSRNQDDPAVATSFGQALREDEQFTRARQVLYPFTEGKNAYPDAVMELAMVQLSLGQYKEAELTARKAVEMDPNSGRAYLALGTALDAQNYHEQAEVAFRRGIDNWKGDPAPIMNNLALNLASQNKLDQAIDMLQKAKEISPGRIEIERNLRIVSTLKEGADDFIIKQQQDKKQAAKPAPAPKAKAVAEPAAPDVKKEVVVTETKKVPGTKTKSDEKITREEIDKKQLSPAKKAAPQPEKVEPAASSKTNARGSKQNFN